MFAYRCGGRPERGRSMSPEWICVQAPICKPIDCLGVDRQEGLAVHAQIGNLVVLRQGHCDPVLVGDSYKCHFPVRAAGEPRPSADDYGCIDLADLRDTDSVHFAFCPIKVPSEDVEVFSGLRFANSILCLIKEISSRSEVVSVWRYADGAGRRVNVSVYDYMKRAAVYAALAVNGDEGPAAEGTHESYARALSRQGSGRWEHPVF